jgi:DNA-binding IclR family transcriptional regulator
MASNAGKSPVYRELVLKRDGFRCLYRTPNSHRLHLGAELFRLGVHFFDHVSLVDDYIYATRRIARESDDTTVLGVREGDNWYCLHREDGDFQATC